MKKSLERLVWRRADSSCEYCRTPQKLDASPFQIDHIIGEKHGGPTNEANLALCCLACNLFKGPNIAGIDRDTQSLTRLFHPRVDVWQDHFRWEGPRLCGLTGIGRTTIEVLAINEPSRVAIRAALIAEGLFPTTR
jgi:hypothetical protein